MAMRKPAKLAIGRQARAAKAAKYDPVSGKPMQAVKFVRGNGSSGMFWVTMEDFDGSEKAVKGIIPIR